MAIVDTITIFIREFVRFGFVGCLVATCVIKAYDHYRMRVDENGKQWANERDLDHERAAVKVGLWSFPIIGTIGGLYKVLQHWYPDCNLCRLIAGTLPPT